MQKRQQYFHDCPHVTPYQFDPTNFSVPIFPTNTIDDIMEYRYLQDRQKYFEENFNTLNGVNPLEKLKYMESTSSYNSYIIRNKMRSWRIAKEIIASEFVFVVIVCVVSFFLSGVYANPLWLLGCIFGFAFICACDVLSGVYFVRKSDKILSKYYAQDYL